MTSVVTAHRRRAVCLISAVAAAGLVAAPVVSASATRSATPDSAATRIGHVAYVTASNQVNVVGVNFTGATSRPRQIGPITSPPRGRSITISGFVASGDGHWVAWDEVVTKANGEPTSHVTLVLRELHPDHVYRLRTNDVPVGFADDHADDPADDPADDHLVTYGSNTSVVVRYPSPHLVAVAGDDPLAAYPQGTVTVQPLDSPPGPQYTEELGLTTFDGAITVLHDYVVSPGDSEVPTRGFVSGDDAQLVVELGSRNPLRGQSASLDEYSLSDPSTRDTLGHLGAAAAGWRIGDLSFASSTDQVWAVWHRAASNGIDTVLAVRQPDGWQRIMRYAIAVAGNPDGYVIAQVGTEVQQPGGQITRVPGGDALLLHGTVTKVLGIGGTAFAWVA